MNRNDGDPGGAHYLNSFWLRSSDGLIGGVCQGIGKRIDISPWIIRLLWLASVCFLGTGIFLYILFWLAMPSEKDPTLGRRSVVLGVCFRLSRKLETDVAVFRLLALLLVFTSFGAAVIMYIVIHAFLPKSDLLNN